MKMNYSVHIDIEKNGNTFSFVMPIAASWGSAYDAAFEVLQQITKAAAEATEKVKPPVTEDLDGSHK